MGKEISFIARSDDLGSSFSANQAIEAVSGGGFVKNVSVMAPGYAVEDGASRLAHRKDLCFGMHTTLNAEWDKVKWRPLLPVGEESGLVDENGYFLNDPQKFAETKPDLELVMKEVDAQLERLHALGFAIKYLDSHMFPESFIAGMDEAMAEYAKKKGLIDHMYFYNLTQGLSTISADFSQMLEKLKALPAG